MQVTAALIAVTWTECHRDRVNDCAGSRKVDGANDGVGCGRCSLRCDEIRHCRKAQSQSGTGNTQHDEQLDQRQTMRESCVVRRHRFIEQRMSTELRWRLTPNPVGIGLFQIEFFKPVTQRTERDPKFFSRCGFVPAGRFERGNDQLAFDLLEKLFERLPRCECGGK